MKSVFAYLAVYCVILLGTNHEVAGNPSAQFMLSQLSGLLGAYQWVPPPAPPTTLIMEMSGYSMSDCAVSFQGVDLSGLTCPEFLSLLWSCPPLAKAKPVLRAAKKMYMKRYSKRAAQPCASQ